MWLTRVAPWEGWSSLGGEGERDRWRQGLAWAGSSLGGEWKREELLILHLSRKKLLGPASAESAECWAQRQLWEWSCP